MQHEITLYFDHPDGQATCSYAGPGDLTHLAEVDTYLSSFASLDHLRKVTVNSHTILVPPGTQDVRRKVTTFISFLLGQTNHGPI